MKRWKWCKKCGPVVGLSLGLMGQAEAQPDFAKQADKMKAQGVADVNKMKAKGTSEAEAMKAKGTSEAEAMKAKGTSEAEAMKAKGMSKADEMTAKGMSKADKMKATGESKAQALVGEGEKTKAEASRVALAKELKDEFEGQPIPTEVRADLETHAARMAKLDRARSLATEEGKKETVARVDSLIEKEKTRHQAFLEKFKTDLEDDEEDE